MADDDGLLDQVKLTNQLLRLAFGEAIEQRVASLSAQKNTERVLETLADQGELSMDNLQKASAVPRSSLYALVAHLDRLGVVERPRRGFVALSRAAAPYIVGSRRAEATSGD